MSNQTDLNVILDGIEELSLLARGNDTGECRCSVCRSSRNVPALVKALRRANSFITWVALDPKLELEASGARNAITAILQASSEPKKD